MVLLENAQNKIRFSLSVLGYEFPDLAGPACGDATDRNWLLVRCCLERDGAQPVCRTRPMLLTYELEEIPKRLRRVLLGQRERWVGEFREPDFRIEASRTEVGFTVKVRWQPPAEEGAMALFEEVSFDLDPGKMAALCDAFEGEADSFPKRGTGQ